jgi:hypothetical protein
MYLLNRSLTRPMEGMTPFEDWHGRKSGLGHLHTFGYIVHVKNTKPHLKAYRAYDPQTGRVHVSREDGGVHIDVNAKPFEIEVITTTDYALIPGRSQVEQDQVHTLGGGLGELGHVDAPVSPQAALISDATTS